MASWDVVELKIHNYDLWTLWIYGTRYPPSNVRKKFDPFLADSKGFLNNFLWQQKFLETFHFYCMLSTIFKKFLDR